MLPCPCLWMGSSEVSKTITFPFLPERATSDHPIYFPRAPVSKWPRVLRMGSSEVSKTFTSPVLPERTTSDHPRLLYPLDIFWIYGCWTTRDCCPPTEHRVPHSHASPTSILPPDPWMGLLATYLHPGLLVLVKHRLICLLVCVCRRRVLVIF